MSGSVDVGGYRIWSSCGDAQGCSLVAQKQLWPRKEERMPRDGVGCDVSVPDVNCSGLSANGGGLGRYRGGCSSSMQAAAVQVSQCHERCVDGTDRGRIGGVALRGPGGGGGVDGGVTAVREAAGGRPLRRRSAR